MKTYVITLSKTFPKTHKRAGEPTNFRTLFETGVKKHTIRANYPLWKKRMEEVQEGKACLSIRQWSGKPYASKQEEICRLTADNGVGIQKVFINPNMFNPELLVVALDREGNGFNTALSSGFLAEYDGLPFLDWHDWFKNYDHSQPFAIIHFTKFRY